MIEFASEHIEGANIKVIGVGGGGGNAITNMIESGLEGVEFIACNTDLQALHHNMATQKLQIGEKLTQGLGAGANPETGRRAATEDLQEIAEFFEGADMVFITAGMGGGTGTGAAPVLAQVARDAGALTVGVVTKPFPFEGRRRMMIADQGIEELRQAVDTLIVIPNERLLSIAEPTLTLRDSFNMVDGVLLSAVRGISDLILVPGLINVDFADLRTIMGNKGKALMGSGTCSREGRAVEAARMAIESPLLDDTDIAGATGILVNITGGPDLSLQEVNGAISLISEAAHPDCNIIFGSVINSDMVDEVKITVVATGFDGLTLQEEDEDPFFARSEFDPPEAVVDRRQSVAVAAKAGASTMMGQDGGDETDYDRPTYVRRQGVNAGSSRTARDPVTTNPFVQSDQSEFDTPTFLRK